MIIKDNLQFERTKTQKRTKEGYLTGLATVTKVGIQQYDKSQITGNIKDAGMIVNVFRPHDVVFNDATQESLKMQPMTYHHPQEQVLADNYANHSVGFLGENPKKLDDLHLGINYKITDSAIIEYIEDKKKDSNSNIQISLGYNANFIDKKGSYDNQDYDYEFIGAMDINHCALVENGRCGDSVGILDNAIKTNGDKSMRKELKKTVNDEIEEPKTVEPEIEEVKNETVVETKTEDKPIVKDVKIDDAMINAIVDKKMLINDSVSTIIGDKSKLKGLKNREALELGYKHLMGDSTITDSLSDDTMLGAITYAAKSIDDATQEQRNISKEMNISDDGSSHAYSAAEIRKMENKQ